jgi:hypothetical protein
MSRLAGIDGVGHEASIRIDALRTAGLEVVIVRLIDGSVETHASVKPFRLQPEFVYCRLFRAIRHTTERARIDAAGAIASAVTHVHGEVVGEVVVECDVVGGVVIILRDEVLHGTRRWERRYRHLFVVLSVSNTNRHFEIIV